MRLRFYMPFVLAALALAGCESKKVARANARAAYAEGQAQAYRQVQEQQRSTVRIVGNVKTPEFAWEPEMTLAGVLLVAECQGKNSPRQITIVRRGERMPVDMKAFLKGVDFAIESGDTVELHP